MVAFNVLRLLLDVDQNNILFSGSNHNQYFVNINKYLVIVFECNIVISKGG